MKRTLEHLKRDCAENKADATASLLREAKSLATELTHKAMQITRRAQDGMTGSILTELSFLEATVRRAKECMENEAERIRMAHAIERALETTELQPEPTVGMTRIVCSNKLAEIGGGLNEKN